MRRGSADCCGRFNDSQYNLYQKGCHIMDQQSRTIQQMNDIMYLFLNFSGSDVGVICLRMDK